MKYIIEDRFKEKDIGWVSEKAFKLPKKLGQAWRNALKDSWVFEKKAKEDKGKIIELQEPFFKKDGFEEFLRLFLDTQGDVFRIKE